MTKFSVFIIENALTRGSDLFTRGPASVTRGGELFTRSPDTNTSGQRVFTGETGNNSKISYYNRKEFKLKQKSYSKEQLFFVRDYCQTLRIRSRPLALTILQKQVALQFRQFSL